MKIKTTRWGFESVEQVSSYVERMLDDNSDCGKLESIASSLSKSSSATARLIEILASKGLLTAGEIVEVVKGYDDGSVELINHAQGD